MAGLDFSQPTADYENLLRMTKHLTRDYQELCEQFKRMLFNLLASNRDDHAKNFAFRMDAKGNWHTTPAYDLIYTDNQLGGNWMLLSGKRNGIRHDDLVKLAELHGISRSHFKKMLDQILEALVQWPDFAQSTGLDSGLTKVVQTVLHHMKQELAPQCDSDQKLRHLIPLNRTIETQSQPTGFGV